MLPQESLTIRKQMYWGKGSDRKGKKKKNSIKFIKIINAELEKVIIT